MPKTDAPEAPKERPIRNREIDKKAAALAEKYLLPEVPGKNISWDQMQAWLALLTPEMFSHVTLYLYRTRPRIIRQLKNAQAKNYIDCISQPFDMEYMIDRHGGGRYYFEVNDSNVTKRGPGYHNHLFRCHVEVDEVRYPPKLDYEELDINHHDNFSYLQMLKNKGILDDQGKVMANQTQAQSAAAAGGINADVIKEILGFVKSMNNDQLSTLRTRLAPDGEDSLTKSVGQILLEKMKQDDPTKQLQTLSQLVTAVKEIVGTSKPPDNMYGPFIAMLQEQNKALLTMVEKLGNQSRPAREDQPAGGLAQVDKIFDFADRLLQYRGGNGGGGRRSGWDIGLDYTRELMPVINSLLPLALRGRGAPVGAPGVGAQPQGPAPPPAAFDPYANPASLRQYADSLRTPNPQPAAPPPPAAPQGGPTDLAQLLQAYGALIVNALNNGTPGYDFADYVCGLFGNSTHALIAGAGEEMIVQNMLRVPELSLFGEPRLRTFTHEFIHHEEILKAAAAEADAETVEA